jgi:hypothetical protein
MLTSVPRPVALQTTAAALGSLVAQSVSLSVPLPGTDSSASIRAPTGPMAIPVLNASFARHGISRSVPVDDGSSVSGSPPPPADSKAGVIGAVTKNGKKRGTIFTCESCSKVRTVLGYVNVGLGLRVTSLHYRYIATRLA